MLRPPVVARSLAAFLKCVGATLWRGEVAAGKEGSPSAAEAEQEGKGHRHARALRVTCLLMLLPCTLFISLHFWIPS